MTIGFPLYEGFDTLDVLGPLQACTYADLKCVLASADGCAVKSLEEVTVQVDTDFDGAGQWEILWVPGGANLAPILKTGYLGFLRKQAAGATWVCSVCTGALFLAAAGLLDDCVATTHWAYKDVLRLFPGVKVVDDYRRYVQSGNRLTGGGISSGIDEALYLISVVKGVGAARRSQLAMQYHPQPAFQCGDPGEPDIKDNPSLPADIQSDWDVAKTYKDFQDWIGKQSKSHGKRGKR